MFELFPFIKSSISTLMYFFIAAAAIMFIIALIVLCIKPKKGTKRTYLRSRNAIPSEKKAATDDYYSMLKSRFILPVILWVFSLLIILLLILLIKKRSMTTEGIIEAFGYVSFKEACFILFCIIGCIDFAFSIMVFIHRAAADKITGLTANVILSLIMFYCCFFLGIVFASTKITTYIFGISGFILLTYNAIVFPIVMKIKCSDKGDGSR